MRAEPHAIARLAARLPRGSVVVSATNGKTTTAAMVGDDPRAHRPPARAQPRGREHGRRRRHRAGRRARGDMGLFEVDEFWLGPVAAELEPRAMLLANLFRDQLDRYGELEIIADRWAAIVAGLPPGTALVLNADDPLVADLGRDREPLYFGVEDDALALPELQHASDSKHCRRCGHAYAYEAAYLAHLGRYSCPNCGARRPDAAGRAPRRSSCAGSARRPSRSPRRRASAASSSRCPASTTSTTRSAPRRCACSSASPLDDVAAGLGAVAPAFGRAETVDARRPPDVDPADQEPGGANEVLRTLALEGAELDLFGVLNDRTADGRDVSWVWDADWEIVAPHVRRLTCSGTRAAELALRLKYAGVDAGRLEVVDDLERGLDRALAGGEGPLYALPTYTALLELKDVLAARGQRGVLAVNEHSVIWHDLECGGYAADLPLWRRAGREAGGAGARRRRRHRARGARPRARRPRR